MGDTGDPKYNTPQGRKYKYPDKSVGYPGVTTVIGQAWPATFLENWRIGNIAKEMCRRAAELAEYFTRIAKKPDRMRELHAKSLSNDLIEWKDDTTAADRGTRIHAGLEWLLRGETSKKKLRKKMKGEEFATVVAAYDELKRRDFQPEFIEAPVYGHTPVKFAGTVDLIGTIKRKAPTREYRVRVLIDLKTGKQSKAHSAQIAAYCQAEEILTKDGKLVPMPKVKVGLVLYAKPDNAELWRVDIQEGWADFLACYRIYKRAHSTKGMVQYAG